VRYKKMAKKTIQLKDLLSIVGLYDNVKVYGKVKAELFTSKADIPTYLLEKVVDTCWADNDVLAILLKED
jgi:hypothetical protein